MSTPNTPKVRIAFDQCDPRPSSPDKPLHRSMVLMTMQPSSAFPKHDRNLNTDAPLGQTVEMVVAEQRIHHDAEHPLAIVLPIVPHG